MVHGRFTVSYDRAGMAPCEDMQFLCFVIVPTKSVGRKPRRAVTLHVFGQFHRPGPRVLMQDCRCCASINFVQACLCPTRCPDYSFLPSFPVQCSLLPVTALPYASSHSFSLPFPLRVPGTTAPYGLLSRQILNMAAYITDTQLSRTFGTAGLMIRRRDVFITAIRFCVAVPQADDRKSGPVSRPRARAGFAQAFLFLVDNISLYLAPERPSCARRLICRGTMRAERDLTLQCKCNAARIFTRLCGNVYGGLRRCRCVLVGALSFNICFSPCARMVGGQSCIGCCRDHPEARVA